MILYITAMCGFAGVVTWDEKYRVTRDTLEKMSRAIAHRGPDGEGLHLTRENEAITPEAPQVGLAFRRLAILDPDPRSNQPFHLGPLTLVFNGEIYNFRELRAELSQLRPGYAWRTSGDTEVLLLAYEVWREKCVEKLNGMFAFAVWNEQKKELFLARDRMGQKPLYYAFAGSIALLNALSSEQRIESPTIPWIFFASEPHAVKLGRTPGTLQSSLIDYLQHGYQDGQINSLVQLAPGMCVRLGADLLDYTPYYEFEKAEPQFLRKSSRSTKDHVFESVRRQLVSDVPVGVFLSGGIDSSIIARCAREFGPIQTFSIGFDDVRYNESHYAAAVAKHLGTTHHQFTVRPDAVSDLNRLAAVFGEPFADSSALPTHYLARETRKHVKVALSGDGGDELFGGYDRYRAINFTSRISHLPPVLRRVISTLAKPWSVGHPKSMVTRIARLAQFLEMEIAKQYASYMRFFDDQMIKELLLDNEWLGLHDSVEEEFHQRMLSGKHPVRAAAAVDRVTYLPNDILTKVDRCSMMHGLEVRSPFMDHELVQFAAGLTTDQLLKGGPKRMLREAFAKDLPDFVFKRKKMGFAVPIGEWFRGELRPMLRENLFATNSFGRSHFNMKVVERLVEEHESQRIDHSKRLYALLMLELWWQQQK